MIRACLLLVCLGLSRGAPLEEGSQAASCSDPIALGAANEAMDKINRDRSEGYVFALRSLVNSHTQQHGENSIVFYLTMNVQETNCSVLSGMHFKNCEVRDITQTPVYGQCKAAIFISRVNRVVRLYKYNCVVRPVPGERVHRICPDCPSHVDKNNAEIQKTVSRAVEKFNKNSGLSKYFKLLQITRATSGYGMGMMYFAQFTIQETTCANPAQNPGDCPLMDCEFSHKGLCKASHIHGLPDPSGEAEDSVKVDCEIYEPKAAEEEKKLHLLGAAGDHSHDDTQASDHSHDHHHTHHGHSHTHPHSHGHGHAHAHGHHDNAHDHSRDRPHQHHQYDHAAGVSTHDHDHELALDHAHNHSHLHEHEHHHHHHHHPAPPHKPQGLWRQTPPLGPAVTLPAFPELPVGPGPGVTLPAAEDPQIPGQMEPTIGLFPTKLSPECPPVPPPADDSDIVATLLAEDAEFKLSA